VKDIFNLMIHYSIERFNTSPVEAFAALYEKEPYAFLYESLELGGTYGRYSFLGGKPEIIFKAKNGKIYLSSYDRIRIKYGNPFFHLCKLIRSHKKLRYFAPFTGGAVGYVSYDSIRYIEKIPDENPDELKMPDLLFIFPQEIIIFDHKYKTARIIVYHRDKYHLKFIKEVLCSKLIDRQISKKPSKKLNYNTNFSPREFYDVVKRAKDYIYAGDIFQVVLSQRFKTKVDSPNFDIYRALRITNPSPYMYYLKLGATTILGSSPETLIKLNNKTAISRPLAGTRPRGGDNETDKKLAHELLKDEKEIAEHIMLVDLARNDLGRVCQYGTVKPTVLLKIERYSKVMHIVSNVTGRLCKDCDAIDLFIASFPAGTVSGAPKIRAMEIIDELEPVKRGLYAGAIGYFDFNGNMDFCIAIRTIIIKDNIAYIQGGAGIVADSIPEKEYDETINKTKALKSALEMV